MDLSGLNAAGLGSATDAGTAGAWSPRRLGLGAEVDGPSGGFGDWIGRAVKGAGQAQTPEAKARSAAEQFVAAALVQPLLKQLRETNQAAPPFGPSQGEKQFQSLYDAEIAQRMVKAANFPLVDRLARDLMKGKGAKSVGSEKTPTGGSVEKTKDTPTGRPVGGTEWSA